MSRNNKQDIWFFALLVTLILFVGIATIIPVELTHKRNKITNVSLVVCEHDRVCDMTEIILDIIRDNGRVILSEDELYRSAYYPFKEVPSQSVISGGAIHLVFEEKDGNFEITGHTIDNSSFPVRDHILAREPVNISNFGQLTKKLEQLYLGGIKKHITQLNSIRHRFYDDYLSTIQNTTMFRS